MLLRSWSLTILKMISFCCNRPRVKLETLYRILLRRANQNASVNENAVSYKIKLNLLNSFVLIVRSDLRSLDPNSGLLPLSPELWYWTLARSRFARQRATIKIGRQRRGDSRPRLGNGIGLKREEAVIVSAGARHLIWHSRRKSRGCVCTISRWWRRTSPSLSLWPPRAPRHHAASTGGKGGEGASKLRNPPPAGRLEFTPQAGQPNGNKKLRQTALPTPRRPGNIAPTTPT